MPGDLIPYDESGGWDGFGALLVPLAFRQEVERVRDAINAVGVALGEAFSDAARAAIDCFLPALRELHALMFPAMVLERRQERARHRKRLRARAKAGRGRGR